MDLHPPAHSMPDGATDWLPLLTHSFCSFKTSACTWSLQPSVPFSYSSHCEVKTLFTFLSSKSQEENLISISCPFKTDHWSAYRQAKHPAWSNQLRPCTSVFPHASPTGNHEPSTTAQLPREASPFIWPSYYGQIPSLQIYEPAHRHGPLL